MSSFYSKDFRRKTIIIQLLLKQVRLWNRLRLDLYFAQHMLFDSVVEFWIIWLWNNLKICHFQFVVWIQDRFKKKSRSLKVNMLSHWMVLPMIPICIIKLLSIFFFLPYSLLEGFLYNFSVKIWLDFCSILRLTKH